MTILPRLRVAGSSDSSPTAGALAGQAATNADRAEVERRAEALRRHGMDPASPLEARVRETPSSVLKTYAEAREVGQPSPRAYAPTAADRRTLSAAFAALPPLHRRVLRERLRCVSFLDGMPNTGLTSPVDPDAPYRLFDITIRAGVLRQTASEWLTEKERALFDAAGSSRSVSVEAGRRSALDFVLLHEATHAVDFCLGLTPPLPSGPPEGNATPPEPTEFTRGVWSAWRIPAPPYRDPEARERVRFFPPGRSIPIDRAEAVYASLRRTPFVSLYGGTSWGDDLAEYATVYHWTEVLKQPYRIVLRENGREVFSYAPMRSGLVRSRIGQMKRFYEPPVPGDDRQAPAGRDVRPRPK